MLTLRNTYPDGDRFDEHYFLSRHIPLAQEILGSDVQAVRVFRPVQVAGQAPAPRMVVEFDFPSREAMDRAFGSPRMAELGADVANYSSVRGVMTVLDDGK